MGAYAYCSHCELGLDRPTTEDVQMDSWSCAAGHHNELRRPPIEYLCEIISDLEERIETGLGEIEYRLSVCENRQAEQLLRQSAFGRACEKVSDALWVNFKMREDDHEKNH